MKRGEDHVFLARCRPISWSRLKDDDDEKGSRFLGNSSFMKVRFKRNDDDDDDERKRKESLTRKGLILSEKNLVLAKK